MREKDEQGLVRVPVEDASPWFCPSCGRQALEPVVMLCRTSHSGPVAQHRIISCTPCGWEFEVVLWKPLR